MKKFFLITLSIPILILNGQNIDIKIELKTYPLLKAGNEIIMAASQYAGVYNDNVGLNLQEHPLNNGSFIAPEFLVLHHFINMKNGNMEALKQLHEPVSRKNLEKIVNIKAAVEAYKDFDDFTMLSKSVFGDFVRLRYNLINKKGEPIPWILIAKKMDDRYFLTESISHEHIFISLSSENPYNLSNKPFENCKTEGLAALYLDSDGSETKQVNSMAAGRLGIYFKLTRIDENKEHQEEVKVLHEMKEMLKDTSNYSFIELWDTKNKQYFKESDFYLAQIEVQRQFYKQVDKLKPIGVLNAGDEIVLFYLSEIKGGLLSLQLLPLIKENNKYKLTDSLKEYYAWQVLTKPVVLLFIEKTLKGH